MAEKLDPQDLVTLDERAISNWRIVRSHGEDNQESHVTGW